jgi:hypothetical protein
LILLAAASFGLRLAAGRQAVSDPVSSQIASSLLAGQGYTLKGALGGRTPTALRMPAVPSLLVLSDVTPTAMASARFLWAVLGAGLVVAVGIATTRWFGKAAGLVAAALTALLPNFWLQSVRIDSATVAGLILAVLLMTMAVPVGGSPTAARVGMAGALAGLLALTRPEGIVVGVAMVGVWVAVSARHLSPRRGAMLGLVAVVGVLLVYGPWAIRTQSQFHTLLPTTLTGTVVAGANAPTAYRGPFMGSWDPAAAAAATQAVSTTLMGEGQLDRRLQAEARTYAGGHVARLIPTAGVRFLRTFGLWSPVNGRAVHAARGISVRGWVLQWAAALTILVLACLGFWHRRRELVGRLAPLAAAPAAVAVIALVTYGEPIMRSAIDPVLAVAAAAAVARFGQRLGPRLERVRVSRRPKHRSRAVGFP